MWEILERGPRVPDPPDGAVVKQRQEEEGRSGMKSPALTSPKRDGDSQVSSRFGSVSTKDK